MENLFEIWNAEENRCKHNDWDIGLNVPICTHPYTEYLPNTIFVCMGCQHKPYWCPDAFDKRFSKLSPIDIIKLALKLGGKPIE